MPRSQSSSSSSRKSFSSTPSRPVVHSAPTSLAPMPTSAAPSFGQTLKEGLAFGSGQAIAHRLVGSIFGGSSNQSSNSSQPTPKPLCDNERIAFEVCMKTKSQDDYCGHEQIAYAQCVRASSNTEKNF